MSTPVAITVTTALMLLCLAATRLGRGFRTWPRADRITYLVLCAAVWPWLYLGYVMTPPWWYTAAAGTATAGALIAFLIGQVLFLRQSRRDLAQLRAELHDEP